MLGVGRVRPIAGLLAQGDRGAHRAFSAALGIAARTPRRGRAGRRSRPASSATRPVRSRGALPRHTTAPRSQFPASHSSSVRKRHRISRLASSPSRDGPLPLAHEQRAGLVDAAGAHQAHRQHRPRRVLLRFEMQVPARLQRPFEAGERLALPTRAGPRGPPPASGRLPEGPGRPSAPPAGAPHEPARGLRQVGPGAVPTSRDSEGGGPTGGIVARVGQGALDERPLEGVASGVTLHES